MEYVRTRHAIIIFAVLTLILAGCAHVPAVKKALSFEFTVCADLHHGCENGDTLSQHTGQWQKRIASSDFLVAAGDLTCDGTLKQLGDVFGFLSSLGKPFYTLPGNHDVGEDDDATYRGIFQRTGSYVVEHRGVALVFLDISDGQKAHVKVTDSIVEEVKDILAGVSNDMPVIVFSHYPLHPATPRFAVGEAERLFSLFDRKTVLGYFSGHYHALWSAKRRGVPFFTTGSPMAGVVNHDSTTWHGFLRVRVGEGSLTVEPIGLGLVR